METKLVLAEINPQAPKGKQVKVIDQKTVKLEAPKKQIEAVQGPSRPQVQEPQPLETKEPKFPNNPTVVKDAKGSMPLGLKLATGALGVFTFYRLLRRKKKD